ncbi:M48 family metalloprotease [Kutzneria buriramensis]|uniref:Zn-dependent protease with chaperone function n=1 Tax=Kutzneria buriramensis TaxID=1045776 RepID=A0A3E0H5H3_9PSEU|nr:M48 family metalloprotease [Kutzneria buriramensis]REH38163.1 Zn-dependent protease with chaperone function [Kutzneria buriramensis]
MTTLRAVLAILMLSGVYVIALVGVAICGGLAILCADVLQSYMNGETHGYITSILFGLAGLIVAVVVVLSSMFAVGGIDADTPSVPVDEEQAPELWAFVREVAAEAGIRPPHEVRLTGEVNGSVSEDARLLGLLPGRRRLHLGLPLLAELSANELRALLGHEFGHYLGWHTRGSTIVYRGFLALERLHNNLASAPRHILGNVTRLFASVFRAYAHLYARVSFAVRRQQEFEADAVAARIAGPESVARTLRSLAAIDAFWHVFTQKYLLATAGAGYAPEDPLAMFAAMLSDEHRRRALDELKAADPEPQPHDRFASHPSMADRLTRLAAMESDVPAWLREPEPSTWRYPGRKLIEHLLPGQDVEALPAKQWRAKAARVGAPTAAARTLLHAAGPDATLATVLELLEAGEATQLATRFDKEDPLRAMARLCEALHALAGHYLVEAGSAHWRLSWTGPSELVVSELRDDGVRVLPFAELNALVFEAVDSDVDRLRLYLASLRVDPQRPRPFDAEPALTLVTAPFESDHDRAARNRVYALCAVVVVAFVAITVIADNAPPAPPRAITTVLPETTSLPTVDLPTSTYFQFDPGTELSTTLSTTPLVPRFDATSIGAVVVRPGDTLDKLARCYLTTVHTLQKLNNLGYDNTELAVGQTLLVPNAIRLCP